MKGKYCYQAPKISRSSPESHHTGSEGDKYVNLIGVEDVDNIHNCSAVLEICLTEYSAHKRAIKLAMMTFNRR